MRTTRGQDSDNTYLRRPRNRPNYVVIIFAWEEPSQGKSSNKLGRHLWWFSELFFKQSRSCEQTISGLCYLALIWRHYTHSMRYLCYCAVADGAFHGPSVLLCVCEGMMINFQGINIIFKRYVRKNMQNFAKLTIS